MDESTKTQIDCAIALLQIRLNAGMDSRQAINWLRDDVDRIAQGETVYQD